MHCILGNIIKSDTWLSSQATAVTKESIYKFSKETKQIKLAKEILWAWKYIFNFFFCHCWKSLLREWKVNTSVESNIWKRKFWKRDQMQNILKAHCWEPAWGTPPVAKVMRKKAQHTQRRDQASGDPLFRSIYPQNQSLPALGHYAFHLFFWYYGGWGGGLSPTTFLWKELT